MDDQTNQRGRPTKHTQGMDKRAKKLARLGFNNDEMATILGIDRATFYRWMNKYKGFCDAVTSGKLDPDTNVMNALYRKATGYKYTEVHEVIEDGEVVSVKQIKKHMQPDMRAIEMWLINRMPEIWKVRPKNDDGLSLKDLLSNITTVADLVNNPVRDRTFEDVEEDNNDE